jgi:hypothetical protein
MPFWDGSGSGCKWAVHRQGGSWLQLVEAVCCILMTGFCRWQFVAGLDVGNVFQALLGAG